MTDIQFLLEYHDRRETELLTANNRLVSERNLEQGKREHFQSSVDFLLRHNGMRQLREAQAACRHLVYERDMAQEDARRAWAVAEKHMVTIQTQNGSLTAKAIAWFKAIRNLERARSGHGNVLEANRAYTEAQLALKAEASIQIERE